jgi:hypothetical protein
MQPITRPASGYDYKAIHFQLRFYSDCAHKMQKNIMHNPCISALFASLCSVALPVLAQEDTAPVTPYSQYNLTLSTSVATRHFHPSPEHNNHQGLINLEWNYDKHFVVGGATFSNSYNQDTQLVYWGAKFRPLDSTPDLYVKVVGGLIHGYKDQYQDNIPLNNYGTAPVILPAVGYCYKHLCTEVIVFGTAGAMWTAGVRF